MGKYQLVLLGDRNSPRVQELQDAVASQVKSLGLNPKNVISFQKPSDSINWRLPIVGIWFATEVPANRQDIDTVNTLLNQGVGIFPALEDLTRFQQLVPSPLHQLNGLEWSRGAARLGSEVLRAFGLTRSQRSAFISYRRTDSRAVALQLFHALGEHGYRAFLDTASVDFGAQFQDVLWDRMADVDLLIFLDTPGALNSTWVNQELTRAHNLGMGILQIRWPDWKGFPGADLSFQFPLTPTDFSGEPKDKNQLNPDSKLKLEILNSLMKTVEDVRMRSLGSRRARIVGEIVQGAKRSGMTTSVDPIGSITLHRNNQQVGKALPITGLPDSEEIFRSQDNLGQGGNQVRILYDGLGVHQLREDYLAWLNIEMRNYQTLPISELKTWLKVL